MLKAATTKSSAKELMRLSQASIRPHLPRNSYALHGPPVALSDVSWTIRPRENWLCIGPNGSGKTTLARALLGKANVVKGEIHSTFKSAAFVSFAEHEKVRSATDFFLSHGANLREEGLTVGSFLNLSTKNDKTQQQHEEEEEDFLSLDQLSERTLASLSSGELRRVCLLKALGSKPDLLVLDEAFDFLDPDKRVALARRLNAFAQANPQTTIILVSHRKEDSTLLNFLTHEISLTGEGKVREIKSLTETQQEEEEPVSVLMTDNVLMGTKTQQSFTSGNAESTMIKPIKLDEQALSKLIDRTYENSILNDEDPSNIVDEEKPVAAVRIQQANVCFSLNTPPVLTIDSLTIEQGERVFLCGPSGAGKSLLLSILAGEHPQAFSNDVLVFNKRMGAEETLEDRRRRVALFSHAKAQSMFANNPFKTALEVVEAFMNVSHGRIIDQTKEQQQQRELALEWLKVINPGIDPHKPYLRLSQGQRAAVLLTGTFASRPKLLLLDEPFAGLDVHARDRLSSVVKHLVQNQTRKVTVVATSHYMGDFDYFKRILTLRPLSSSPPSLLFATNNNNNVNGSVELMTTYKLESD